jgi:protein gp37
MALRLKAMGQPHYVNGFKLTMHEDALDKPLHWKKPRMVFVNSMSDLFHKDIPFAFVQRVFYTMRHAKQHSFQVLTKRPERMQTFLTQYLEMLAKYPLRNVWLGVSVESARYKSRINILRKVNAAIRFISFEPLLEDIGTIDLTGIHWVIIGGESGPGARPFNIDWARNIIRQCREQKVAVFMKQVGAHPIGWDMNESNFVRAKLKSRKGGDPKEWPPDLRIREYPAG